ncbi:hypothetical protein ACFRAO_37395 [Streptomyces sp. NPDC056656]|uniref:hypothetical protein n=1 Tax=Streptomyces sp. NPDC056656 TaxID=3345895 RepID=UPI0036D03CC9
MSVVEGLRDGARDGGRDMVERLTFRTRDGHQGMYGETPRPAEHRQARGAGAVPDQ